MNISTVKTPSLTHIRICPIPLKPRIFLVIGGEYISISMTQIDLIVALGKCWDSANNPIGGRQNMVLLRTPITI